MERFYYQNKSSWNSNFPAENIAWCNNWINFELHTKQIKYIYRFHRTGFSGRIAIHICWAFRCFHNYYIMIFFKYFAKQLFFYPHRRSIILIVVQTILVKINFHRMELVHIHKRLHFCIENVHGVIQFGYSKQRNVIHSLKICFI